MKMKKILGKYKNLLILNGLFIAVISLVFLLTFSVHYSYSHTPTWFYRSMQVIAVIFDLSAIILFSSFIWTIIKLSYKDLKKTWQGRHD